MVYSELSDHQKSLIDDFIERINWEKRYENIDQILFDLSTKIEIETYFPLSLIQIALDASTFS